MTEGKFCFGDLVLDHDELQYNYLAISKDDNYVSASTSTSTFPMDIVRRPIHDDEKQYNFLARRKDNCYVSASTSTSNFSRKPKIETHTYTVYYICALVLALVIVVDMKEKIYSHSTENLIEIQECTRLFTINRCLDKVPLTEQMCLKWEKCMAQNSKSYYLLQIISSLAALVIQSLFENLQLNTIGILMLSSAFGMYLLYKLK